MINQLIDTSREVSIMKVISPTHKLNSKINIKKPYFKREKSKK